MKELFKKKIIVVLLLVSCLISGYIFFTGPEYTGKTLQSLSQADSLIQEELYAFNIQPRDIQTETVTIDSTFSRKIFQVDMPAWMAKTQFHAELNATFYDYSVATPAQVLFPDQHMKIHLLYQDTVIRTVFLKTRDEQTANSAPVAEI